MVADSFKERLETVYRADGDQALLDRAYDDWADDYERDIWSSGNPKIAVTIGLVERHVGARNSRILDCGCGPGILAALLKMIGYVNIVGIDASDAMLAVAATKRCYAELHKKYLAADIDLADESFDAVIASGILTQGHAPPDALDGILRIAKPARR